MKAIALAIVVASFNLIPRSEFDTLPDSAKAATAGMALICTIAFFLCLLFEDKK